MDEAAWLAATDPAPMMEYARDAVSDRKRRLVMCAAARLLWDEMPEPELREAVTTGERFADGLLDVPEPDPRNALLHRVILALRDRDLPKTLEWYRAMSHVKLAHVMIASASIMSSYYWPRHLDLMWDTPLVHDMIGPHLPGLCREVIGNPFRPVTVRPEWRTSDAVGVAEAITAGRDYGALPVLADALQDAGCDVGELLGHLRGGGVHVRGCWAVDVVLGRA